MLAKDYKGYKGLPVLAGLETMEDAIAKGLTVAESVDRLKRYHWTCRRLSLLLTSRITAMPIYELKMAFGLHAHYLAEHTESFFNRVREMREPPYGMDVAPHAALDLLLDEIGSAPEMEPFLYGVYGVVIPALTEAIEAQMGVDNKLFDHPTYRVLRWALPEIRDIDEYGEKALAIFLTDEVRSRYAKWMGLLRECLGVMGGLDGVAEKKETDLGRIFSGRSFSYGIVPARDERFKDVFNMGVNAEAFLLDAGYAALPKTIMLYFKRMREIDVPEMMASIIWETKDKPWAYYKDMIRQLWDESRHAMMGEVGFTSIDIDWKRIPFNLTWSYLLNTRMGPKDRHAILFFIEQGLMPARTGKQYEWEVAVATANKLTSLIQDYDWADEVLHARIGRDWLVPELGGQTSAMEYGNKAWTEALKDAYDKFEEEGLTRHANWWAGIYSDACKYWGVAPDPKVLEYDLSYRDSRPDRKQLATE
ncbi:MAG TPA: hypothetical protein VGM30_14550 [Puia sp.]|jgi:hypothetical protein